MERANHINIAMMDDIDVNGTSRSKVMSDIDQNKQPCGSTVSFHNIQYKVQLKGGVFCKKKTSPKEILVDLKLVLTASSVLYLFFSFVAAVSMSLFGLLHRTNFTYRCKVWRCVVFRFPSAKFSRICIKL